MAHMRYNIDLAFKMPVSVGTQAKVDKLVTEILAAKDVADTINPGEDNAEPPNATSHICRHDEGLPCDPPEPLAAEVQL